MVFNSGETVRAFVTSKYRLNTIQPDPTTGITGETTGNFTFSFNEDIMRITEIIVESIQIPYSFYVINALNNSLTFDNQTVEITIPPGNYTTTTLASKLTALINAGYNDTTTTVSFNYSTFTLTISRGTAFIIDSLYGGFGSPFTGTAARLLGFDTGTTLATSATSSKPINISGPNYLLLRSNFLSRPISNKMVTNAHSSVSYNDVILTVPVSASPGDIITLDEKMPLPIKFGYKFNILNTDIIDFTITDEEGTIMDFNEIDYSIQFAFITE
jgi:hypothetical protein